MIKSGAYLVVVYFFAVFWNYAWRRNRWLVIGFLAALLGTLLP